MSALEPPRGGLRLTVQDGLIVALAAVIAAQALLFVRMERARGPQIATVGVRQMTQAYLASLATSNLTPQEAGVRTERYLALAEATIRGLSVKDGVLVLARECVLAGEHSDLTAQVSTAVSRGLAERRPGDGR